MKLTKVIKITNRAEYEGFVAYIKEKGLFPAFEKQACINYISKGVFYPICFRHNEEEDKVEIIAGKYNPHETILFSFFQLEKFLEKQPLTWSDLKIGDVFHWGDLKEREYEFVKISKSSYADISGSQFQGHRVNEHYLGIQQDHQVTKHKTKVKFAKIEH